MGRNWLLVHLHRAPVLPRHLLPRSGELLQPVSNYTRKKLVSLFFPFLKKPICICLSPYLNMNSKNDLGTKLCFYAVKIITMLPSLQMPQKGTVSATRWGWFTFNSLWSDHHTIIQPACHLIIQPELECSCWLLFLLANQLSPIVYFTPSGPAC